MFLAEDYSSEIRGALAVAWFAFSLYWAAVCGYVLACDRTVGSAYRRSEVRR